MRQNNYNYPVFLNLFDKKIVIVGGGSVCATKLKGLKRTGAKIVVIAPELSDSCHTLYRDGEITWLMRPYREGDLAGAFLVFAATSDANVNQQIAMEAKKEGILSNICDTPSLSGFINGAWHVDEEISIAVSTHGASPSVARLIRDTIVSTPAVVNLWRKKMRRKEDIST